MVGIFGQEALVVVVVDEAERDLAAADRLDDRAVVRVRPRPALGDRLQPLLRGRLSFRLAHGGDEILERTVLRCDSEL